VRRDRRPGRAPSRQRAHGLCALPAGTPGTDSAGGDRRPLHSGATGYAESIQVTFDPAVISYKTLLEVFFGTHDPTTLNRQGYDQGTEYRSVIFYHSPEQEKQALAVKEQLETEGKYDDPIVTEIVPYTAFYPAEAEHKDYYDNNKNAPYCRIIIDPKIQKLMKHFKEKVKEEYK
jgi:methionine-S-sulfoxide reductase